MHVNLPALDATAVLFAVLDEDESGRRGRLDFSAGSARNCGTRPAPKS
ncbi:hypothetical protein ACQ4WX_03660 [Streptomyces lasalocidi]|nr:hypothetical protein [Streptomyces sp. MUSC 14]